MISSELMQATHDDRDFALVMARWGKWARQDPDRPHRYRCTLGSHQISQDTPDPYDDGMIIPLCDDDALAVDQAVAKVEAGDDARRLLVRWFWIYGADIISILSAAHDLRRALRTAGARFDLVTVLGLKEQILRKTREEIARIYREEKGTK